jgi:hypothetical protein
VPVPTPNQKEQETADRAERIQAAITTLESKIRQIMQEGEVAPKGCYVARYQARGQRAAYWYYKLQAAQPIFPTKDQPSRYKHLGKAGSCAHVDSVIQVARRVQIDELQRAIDSLKQSWADLYSTKEDSGQSTRHE